MTNPFGEMFEQAFGMSIKDVIAEQTMLALSQAAQDLFLVREALKRYAVLSPENTLKMIDLIEEFDKRASDILQDELSKDKLV